MTKIARCCTHSVAIIISCKIENLFSIHIDLHFQSVLFLYFCKMERLETGKTNEGGGNMGRPRNPERDRSMKRYIDADGDITTKELAIAAGVPEVRIRKWKSEDKWEEALKKKPRKRGGQKGNKNAAGKTPAKKGNRNAVTHGAYVTPGYGDIDKEKARDIQSITEGQALKRMIEELQFLLVKREYLEKLLQQYTESGAKEEFYTDKIVHMIVPKSLDEIDKESELGIKMECIDPEPAGEDSEQFKTAMKSVIKDSAFNRSMKVLAELNKTHGRIIKQLDSIKSYELEQQRIGIERERLKLARQKATGEFDLDDESEEDTIDDEGNEY